MCGIFAVTSQPEAAKMVYLGLFALQHRGQESAGIAARQQSGIQAVRREGLVADVFDEDTFAKLPGDAAIGHVRYSTAGGLEEANIQPIPARIGGEPVAISHNGNIVNADALRAKLEAGGAILRGSADTELILHLMAKPAADMQTRVQDALAMLVGAFSLVLLTPTHLFAAVDGTGYRPLVLGRIPGNATGWVLASETCALDLTGAEYVRDVVPGELLTIDLHSGSCERTWIQKNQVRRCSFEHIYFARPDSRLWGTNTSQMRHAIGEALAREAPADADIVIAVPDSGIPMAMGYAEAAGLPYRQGLIRNHYIGRTFIEPTQNVRNFRVRLKLNPNREIIRGKRVVVIDDSIVRGTTSKKIMELLRDAGARELHLRIGSPEVRFPCFYGIDTPERTQLLAQKMSTAKMCDWLKADSLAFLSHEGLTHILKEMSTATEEPAGWCTSCFTGRYNDSIAQKTGNPEVSF